MPVSSEKKHTAQDAVASTAEQPTPLLLSQQEFRQYLRILAQSAVRAVIETVMRELIDVV